MVKSVQGATSISYDYDSDMDEAASARVYCLKVKRRDETIYGFTENSENLTFDLGDGDGEVVYKAKDSIGLTGDIQDREGLAVDNVDATGILSQDEISAADIRAGLFDFAEVTLFVVNFTDLTLGARMQRTGWLGEIMLSDGHFKAELRGLKQAYQQRIVENFTPDCRANLGDSRCGVDLEPPTWTGLTSYTSATPAAGCTDTTLDEGSYGIAALGDIVKPTTPNGYWFAVTTGGTSGVAEPTWDTSEGVGTVTTDSGGVTYQAIPAYVVTGSVLGVTSRKRFEVDFDEHPGGGFSNFWRQGRITWLTGNNASTTWEIARDLSDVSPNELLLYLPAGKEIQVGDTFEVIAGCIKSLAYCRTRFKNYLNFRGEPYVPGTDVQLTYPDGN